MGIYEEIGVKRIINAKGTYTALGGSCMSGETLSAMADAAASYVDMYQLRRAIGEKIARMTHNEAAYVCNGACSGVYLSLLACIALKKAKRLNYVSAAERAECEVIVFRSHMSPYSFVFDQLGVRTVEIGYSNHPGWTAEYDIENAVSERTAAIYYLESGWVASGAPSLELTAAVAERHGIPLVLDAAAKLPPVENLWEYNRRGASVTVFSGGKDIRGPQSSGLILGRKDIIDVILEGGFPTPGMGRMMKVGREEMVGLYSALKQFMADDPKSRAEDAERQVALARELLAEKTCFDVRRHYPNGAGQPIARVGVYVLGDSLDAEDVLAFLAAGDPSIVAGADPDDPKLFYLNPMSMTADEMRLVCRRLLEYNPE